MRSGVKAVTLAVLVVLGWLISVRSVFAAVDVGTQQEGGGWMFSIGDLVNGLKDMLGQMVRDAMVNQLPVQVGTWFLAGLGWIYVHITDALGSLFGSVNFLTQLPLQWITGLPPIQRAVATMTTFSLVIVGVSTALTLLLVVVYGICGKPFDSLVPYFARQALALPALAWLTQLVTWWIGSVVNPLSAQLGDPRTGISQVGTPAHAQDYAVVAVFAIVFAWMLIKFIRNRAMVLVITGLLVIFAPLAVALWCVPIKHVEKLSYLWLATFMGVTFLQIPQVICLSIGAALIGAAFGTHDLGTAGPTEGAVALLMGMGALRAAELVGPYTSGFLKERAGRSGGGGSTAMLAQAVKLGMIASGVGYAAPAVDVAQHAVASQTGQSVTYPPPTVYVGSILGDAPQAQKLLPPPQD